MRTQDIEIIVDDEELLDCLHLCSQVICIANDGHFTPLVVGNALDIIAVANKVLATVEFTESDRVLARMLNVDRCGIDSFLQTTDYSLAADRYSRKLVIIVDRYEPDELDGINFDDEGWPK